MKLLTLVYDQELDNQVTPIFARSMTVTRYSKIEGVIGARMEALAESDFAIETRNNLILAVADAVTMERIVGELHALREQVGYGLRGTVTDVEEVI